MPGIVGDKGLVVKNPAAHHAISAKFEKPIDNKNQDLVVQYEVKLQKGLECGGAYMKLLRNDKKLASDEFSNASPYVIMFGPDKCGTTNKVCLASQENKSRDTDDSRFTSSSSTRTLRLANTKRSISRTLLRSRTTSCLTYTP